MSSSKHEAAIGLILERLLDDGILREGDVQQVFLLSPADDSRTLVLPAPIQNVSVGPRGQRVAWTQKQRYISTAVLKAGPQTTADLSGAASLPGPQEPGPVEQTPWYQEIRDIHDRYVHDTWQEHIDAMNQRYALSGAHKLFTPDPGAPMPWFNGNIEAVAPGRWVLVISLNHYVNPDARVALDRDTSVRHTADTYWDHRRTFNSESWYGRFFGPLARVAAAALGEELTREREPAFATDRMIFTEICPYGSQQFSLTWQTVEEVLQTDLGFQCAAEVNRLLIKKGRPALVMVNGVRSIDMFAHLYEDALKWERIRYVSFDPPRKGRKPKWLWHFCGSLDIGHHSVPVVGFPFLKKPKTHNSNAEVALLGKYVRQCIEDQGCGLSGKDLSA